MALLITASIVIFFDQLSKGLVFNFLGYSEPIQLIKNFFYINHVHNPGAAFGMLPNSRIFFIGFALITIIILAVYCFKQTPAHRFHQIVFGLIIGGATGNLIDRIRFGYVIDFFDFYIVKFHYPTFNIADSCICIGIGLAMYYIIKNHSEVTAK